MSFKLILIFLLVVGCSNSTGFKSEPKPNNSLSIRGFKSKVGGLERNGVALKFHNINKMNKSLLSYKKISTILQIISLAAIVYFITRSLGII